MPSNSQLVHDNSLRPSTKKSLAVLTKSRRLWHAQVRRAVVHNRLPPSCANIHTLLCRTPAIPNNLVIEESIHGNTVFLQGVSLWTNGSTHCGLPNTKRSRVQKVIIASRYMSTCELVEWPSLSWPGYSPESRKSANDYLLAFTLAWCYILCVRQIEVRATSDHDAVSYTEIHAPVYSRREPSPSRQELEMDIGDASSAECRWWASLLASGCGWKAILCRSGQSFYPPWSCHLTTDIRVKIYHGAHEVASHFSSAKPFSSTEAFEYLIDFASKRHVLDQLLAGFTAALTTPKHMRFGAPIQFPRVQPQISYQGCSPQSIQDLLPTLQQIPHYMALSCIPNAISSCLFSSFWEPGIECNLAGEWLHPILDEIVPHLSRERQVFTLLCTMAFRQPRCAPLWLGAALTGLLFTIPRLLGSFEPPISLEAGVWSQSSQSFMDVRFHTMPHTRYGSGDQKLIRREDEFRLLYLTDTQSERYASPPLCPWSPLGWVTLAGTALEVQNHVACGHNLVYEAWVWIGEHLNSVNDHGYSLIQRGTADKTFDWESVCRKWLSLARCSRMPAPVPHSDNISRRATKNALRWTLVDGTKPEDANYWNHEWLEGMLDEDEDEEDEAEEDETI